jgi:hypothetical protein
MRRRVNHDFRVNMMNYSSTGCSDLYRELEVDIVGVMSEV